jgi:thiopeptide-type bacteriocin biosynthesis protein
MYVFGGNLRYVEYKYVNNRRVHQITSVDYSEYLQLIIKHAEKGARIQDLAPLLVAEDITLEEAEAFVQELISSQILISELEPAVTGDEFIYQLIRSLRAIAGVSSHPEITALISTLEEVQAKIDKLDSSLGNPADDYREILTRLKTLNTPIEENQLFQTDSYKDTLHCSLNTSIQESITNVLGFLNKLTPPDDSANRKKFKENFIQAYEDAEVPLLEVLDTESGIGYTGKDTQGIHQLIDDVMIPGQEQTNYEIRWNKLQKILHDKLTEAVRQEAYSVEFTDEDVKDVDRTTTGMPDTISAMFRVLDQSGKLFLGHTAGPSAANLLGRFAHGDKAISHILEKITSLEQGANPDRILAEIVHLPESRIGNILLRPVLRQYEIPYLGKSALPEESQIPLQDLMVSVKHDRIFLRSKKLNKEVVPRLSSAHNYSFNALPVYHFLCDLQTQHFEKSGVGFDWGSMRTGYKFLPRAVYQNVILSKAQWQFEKSDFAFLLDEQKTGYQELLDNWMKKWHLPRQVVLADGDNELYIDLMEPFSLRMLISTIRKRDRIVLEEFLFETDSPVVKDSYGAGYTNEFIAILLLNAETARKGSPAFSAKTMPADTAPVVQRNFSIGSEWLYYKLYCGIKTADTLLGSVLKPLTEELTRKGLADKFFFIRYSDPQGHLRLRFHLTDVSKLGALIAVVDKYLQVYLKQGLIHRILTDTYSRELERYGINSMELSETFFHVDSQATLNLLDMTDGEEGDQIRWQFALRSMDELLDNFQYTFGEKLLFLDQLKTAFTNEHGGTKELKLQLDSKFRNVRKQVEDILNRDLDAGRETGPLIELLHWKSEQLVPVATSILALQSKGQLLVYLDDLLGSYIHMMLNRIFRSRQRTFEMLMYDLLHRYYKSMEGRMKSKKNSNAVV